MTAEIGAKIESPHYHKTSGGDKALIKPSSASHVEVAPRSKKRFRPCQSMLQPRAGGQLMGPEQHALRLRTPTQMLGLRED